MPFDAPQAEAARTRRSSRNTGAALAAPAVEASATLNPVFPLLTEPAAQAAPLSRRAARELAAAAAAADAAPRADMVADPAEPVARLAAESVAQLAEPVAQLAEASATETPAAEASATAHAGVGPADIETGVAAAGVEADGVETTDEAMPAAAVPAIAVATVVAAAAASRRAARRAAQTATDSAALTVPELVEELIATPAAIVTPEIIVETVDTVAAPAEEVVVEWGEESGAEPLTQPAAEHQSDSEQQPMSEQAAAESESATAAQAATDSEPVGASAHDAFAEASRVFGVTADGSAPKIPQAPAAERAQDLGAAASAHLAPRRPRKIRKIITAGASLGVMGVAGLLAVSMTLPAEAVAAGQGAQSTSLTSLVAASDQTRAAEDKGEIQAFVASSDVQNESFVREEDFSTMSLIELAAEEGISYSNDLYTNDPFAAIQWPFKVGVAMSSGYGQRWGRLHAGIDLVPGAGAPIQAIADGVVREATENGGNYGVTVYIDHVIDGKTVTSHYSHMQYGSLRVKTGDTVKVGDIVGQVGNTGRSYGAHLHFEIMIDGATIDPLPWLRENAGRYEY